MKQCAFGVVVIALGLAAACVVWAAAADLSAVVDGLVWAALIG